MRKSDSIAKLAPALVAAQAEVENATKNANNPHFRSQYADLAEIIRTVKPVFTSHGLAIMQMPGLEEGHATVETMLVHESGEWITGMAGAPLAKSDPQGVGSAITYLRRYSLAALAGIAQEDDDGNAASKGTAQPAKTAKAAPKANGGVHATEKQTGLITTLSAASVLTESERDGVRGRLARGMTIGQASEAIDWLNTTIEQRKSEATA